MIYTKTGDGGTTSLVGGTRVPKCHPRVEAYGTVDELNAHIGYLAEMVKTSDPQPYEVLKQVQRHLFVVQTLLATEKEVPFELPTLPDDAPAWLERHIDALQEQVPPFRSFVMPGGDAASAYCHVCRTVCRRAERCIVALSSSEAVADGVLRYVNRLSDYLFVLSRHLVVAHGGEETLFN